MQLYAGTSGYAYDEWKGTFYPEDLPATERLRHYASRLPAVEINNSFYRIPKKDVVAAWRDEVPEDFRFVLKASQRLTHRQRLAGPAIADELAFMLGQFEVLGERLGAVLFQLPPNLKADAERLRAFLGLLPEGCPAAFEFRHASWETEETDGLLRAAGAARVAAHGEGRDDALVPTAPFAYLRLRDESYTDADLTRWRARLEEGGFERAFVFFKHEEAGAGPALAERLLGGRP